MPSPDALAAGSEVLDALAATCARRGVLRALAILTGRLDAARVAPGPDAEAITLSGPLFLVQATASIEPGGIELQGVISWEDQGLPRMIAGRIESAISAGLIVQLLSAVTAAPAEAADPEESDDPAPPSRTPRSEASRETVVTTTERRIPRTGRDSARELPGRELPGRELAGRELPGRELPTRREDPAPAAPREATETRAGWAAAVAVSRAPVRTGPIPPARPRPTGVPTPDELGFEDVPTLRMDDVLVHPRFGRCRVSKVTGRDRVKVRRPAGGMIDLALDVCRFVREPDDEHGHRVFRLIIEG